MIQVYESTSLDNFSIISYNILAELTRSVLFFPLCYNIFFHVKSFILISLSIFHFPPPNYYISYQLSFKSLRCKIIYQPIFLLNNSSFIPYILFDPSIILCKINFQQRCNLCEQIRTSRATQTYIFITSLCFQSN